MGLIKFVQPDGKERSVTVDGSDSVMVAAIKNGIPGIDGECGGCLSCATCHVYIDEDQQAALPPASDDEIEMLDAVSEERRPTSRLGCQIHLPSSVAELVVFVPAKS